MRQEIKLLQPLLSNSIETARKAQDSVGALGARVLGDKIKFSSAIDSPYQADWAISNSATENNAILYLHGGGYTSGSLEYAHGFGGILSELCSAPVLCLAYRLAPENPYPAAIDDALSAYRFMLERYSPEQIAFAGESAGGGLCYALCHRLIAEGLPLPCCIVAISPWADLTLSLDAVTRNAQLDPTLTKASLAMQADMYAEGKLTDPYVSPLNGKFDGFPPSMIFAGSYEILEDDSRALCDKLTACGCECTLHIEEGAWHAYVLYGIYEARQALERIKQFVRENIHEG